jgi:hypothetical protein
VRVDMRPGPRVLCAIEVNIFVLILIVMIVATPSYRTHNLYLARGGTSNYTPIKTI